MVTSKRVGLLSAYLFVLVWSPLLAQEVSSSWPSELPPREVEQLPNGMRVIHLPRLFDETQVGNVDIAFGYAVGLRTWRGFEPGTRAVLSAYLASTVPARSAALAAHLSGGTFAFVDDPELLGMRLSVPSSAFGSIFDQVAAYFRESTLDPEILAYANRRARELRASPSAQTTEEVMDAVRRTLLGEEADLRRLDGAELEPPEPDEIRRYFDTHLGTDRAYLILSDPISTGALAALASVAARTSEYVAPLADVSGTESVELEFPSRPIGGVILATGVPSVHFDGWFQALVIDRLLRDEMGDTARLTLGRSLEASTHWIEVPVEIPGLPEESRDRVLGRLIELGFGGETERFTAAKRGALEYLADRENREWFAAHALSDSIQSGWNGVWNLGAAEVETATRSFATARRVTAMWRPAFEQPSVVVEELTESTPRPEAQAPLRVDRSPGSVRVPNLGGMEREAMEPVRLEHLDSGVTLAPSDSYGLFIAGPFEGVVPGGRMVREGTNGALWLFDGALPDAALDELKAIRPDRLLLFVPSDGFAQARDQYQDWTSGSTDSTDSLGAGDVATIDIPGILVMKTWLEAKVIEAGWWGLVDLRVDGVEGARLVVETDPERAVQVQTWIDEVATEGIAESEFLQVRSASSSYFERIQQDLQIILWQRAPSGSIQPPNTVTIQRLRDVARVYF